MRKFITPDDILLEISKHLVESDNRQRKVYQDLIDFHKNEIFLFEKVIASTRRRIDENIQDLKEMPCFQKKSPEEQEKELERNKLIIDGHNYSKIDFFKQRPHCVFTA